MILASLLAFFYMPRAWILAILLLPMIADGFIQLLTRYESTNFRRVVTGTLFGYGFWSLFILSSILAFRFGQSLAQ